MQKYDVIEWSRRVLPVLGGMALAGCGGGEPVEAEGLVCAAPATSPLPASPASPLSWKGPGGPAQTYSTDVLGVNCAFLDGGPEDDKDHHNTVTMLDGYLVMPWAPEWGGGGLSTFRFDDPCAPAPVGTSFSPLMRETHAAGFARMNGWRAVVNGVNGIQFWDLGNPAAPVVTSDLSFKGVFWPDAYARVVLSVFWQAPYVYVAAADNGIFVVDASDPAKPVPITKFKFDPPLRAGAIFAVGNLLAVMAAEGSRTVLLDIGDPARPTPIPGGTFEIQDGAGVRQEAYHAHLNGDKAWYARKSMGGGVIIYDIANPEAPKYLGDYHAPDGNGGYVFLKENVAFIGESHFAEAVDVSDPTKPSLLRRFNLTGDLDTIIPIGNVVVLSVDDEAEKDQGSAVAPFLEAPDTRGPEVTMVNPRDSASAQPLTTRIGLTFGEFVDIGSLWEGSFLVRKVGTTEPIQGQYSGQEGIVNFWPASPLEPDTEYEVVVPAGGVVDFNGNPTQTEFRSTFKTGPCALPPPPPPYSEEEEE
ncbi:Ig-like domain-containing protein [Polyangium mundeleinium]|uniref:Ig-like domain-containing protein n=1 Tax=Polyangium mundeleinium TaxID=2995306 RepID=A0ABT5ELL6_9BACT|nr:Ig-like domain-containing protein [Polyangium mundeleinium]MDC0742244.1 Ig-like domain-containing protein [Polyangium mundeleinium]